MKLEIEEMVELGVMVAAFILLVVYFNQDFKEIIKQLLIWILATSTTLLVISRIKRWGVDLLRNRRREN